MRTESGWPQPGRRVRKVPHHESNAVWLTPLSPRGSKDHVTLERLSTNPPFRWLCFWCTPFLLDSSERLQHPNDANGVGWMDGWIYFDLTYQLWPRPQIFKNNVIYDKACKLCKICKEKKNGPKQKNVKLNSRHNIESIQFSSIKSRPKDSKVQQRWKDTERYVAQTDRAVKPSTVTVG